MAAWEARAKNKSPATKDVFITKSNKKRVVMCVRRVLLLSGKVSSAKVECKKEREAKQKGERAAKQKGQVFGQAEQRKGNGKTGDSEHNINSEKRRGYVPRRK